MVGVEKNIINEVRILKVVHENRKIIVLTETSKRRYIGCPMEHRRI